MALELIITSPQEAGFVKNIEWNYEELKREVAAKAEEYKGIAYTEDNVKDMKSDKALLNKFRTAIEDERKRVKKLCLEPYERFEQQIKDVVSLIDEPIKLIDSQLKEIDNRYKVEKKAMCQDIYNRNIDTLKGIIPFDRAFHDYYLNKTMTEKKIEEEMKGMFSRVNEELDTIESLHSEYEMQIKAAYISSLDLSIALREKERLETARKAMEERKALEEKKAAEAKLAAGNEIMNPPESPISKSPSETTQYSQEAVPEMKDTMVTIDFRVTCSREQLQLLKTFLVTNKINYGPVPK